MDTLNPPLGLLGYRDGEPIGWIQTYPRSRYVKFKPRAHSPADSVWVITCFVVRVGHRGAGLAAALLSELVNHAQRHGAVKLRAHPTKTSVAKESSSELFTEILSTFDTTGFSHRNRNRSRVLVEPDLTTQQLPPDRSRLLKARTAHRRVAGSWRMFSI